MSAEKEYLTFDYGWTTTKRIAIRWNPIETERLLCEDIERGRVKNLRINTCGKFPKGTKVYESFEDWTRNGN